MGTRNVELITRGSSQCLVRPKWIVGGWVGRLVRCVYMVFDLWCVRWRLQGRIWCQRDGPRNALEYGERVQRHVVHGRSVIEADAGRHVYVHAVVNHCFPRLAIVLPTFCSRYPP
jgi:hypothetical protein